MTARRHDGRTAWTFRTSVRLCVCAAVLTALPPYRLTAQTDVRARLEARGLPADLVDQISAIVADATAQGLPSGPLADKAIEGFAKQVPAPRIVAAVRQFGARMLDARTAVHDAGMNEPAAATVVAAAEALGRGFQPVEVGRVVRAAHQADLAASGLTVAAALAAQGMTTPRAVQVVTSALRGGRSPSQMLDLPSVALTMQSNGLSADEAGQRMMRDGSRGEGPGPGGGRDNEGSGGGGRLGGEGHGPGPGTGTPPPPPRDGRPPSGGNSGPGGGRPDHP